MDSGIDRLFDWVERRGGAVMQYTGLQDRHGREIYEGAIVHRSWDSDGEHFEESIPVFVGELGGGHCQVNW